MSLHYRGKLTKCRLGEEKGEKLYREQSEQSSCRVCIHCLYWRVQKGETTLETQTRWLAQIPQFPLPRTGARPLAAYVASLFLHAQKDCEHNDQNLLRGGGQYGRGGESCQQLMISYDDEDHCPALYTRCKLNKTVQVFSRTSTHGEELALVLPALGAFPSRPFLPSFLRRFTPGLLITS